MHCSYSDVPGGAPEKNREQKMDLYQCSVPDPERFDTDLDPGIHATGVRIRIRILLFSSVALKILVKNKLSFKFFCLDIYTTVRK